MYPNLTLYDLIGDKEDVDVHQRKLTNIAAQFEGFSAGSKNGNRGYLLTFIIAYVRVSYFIF